MAHRASDADVPLILFLISEHGTLDQLAGFLQSSGASPYSAPSWDMVRRSRIPDALASGAVTVESLADFLGELEEHGQQHVFLYRALADVGTFLDETRVEAVARSLGLDEAFGVSLVSDQPVQPEITSIRMEAGAEGRRLSVKIVETREYREPIDEEEHDDYVVVRYRRILLRRVNVFALRQDGLLEVRLQSHRRGTKYGPDIARSWDLAEPFIPQGSFEELPVTPAKKAIWERRKELEGIVRHSKNIARNDLGSEVQVTGTSLDADEHAGNALDEFLLSDSYVRYGNHYWMPQDDGVPSKELHILMTGEVNEFAYTQRCLPEDYQYGLARILEFNG